ncbi:hypothetical protein [Microbispora sp. NPDC049125]|uniref:hypothetical protein n=1 Tax=Microbispora sp. NPDC049125 TaxID=3154929 RepID=UPI003467C88D
MAKAVIAAVLLIVLVALAVLVWKAFLRAGGRGAGRRAALASAGVLVTMLALSSLATVMANVQGAVAPFASLLPMLPAGAPGGELAGTLHQVRRRLAGSLITGDRIPPALDAMISDFSRYHVAMAVIAAIVAAALIVASVVSWRRFAATESPGTRTKGLLGAFGVLSASLSPAVIVVAVANATTAADPAPALSAFFQSGW